MEILYDSINFFNIYAELNDNLFLIVKNLCVFLNDNLGTESIGESGQIF